MRTDHGSSADSSINSVHSYSCTSACDLPWQVTRADLLSGFYREYYEGTPYDLSAGPAAGPFGTPIRKTPCPHGSSSLQLGFAQAQATCAPRPISTCTVHLMRQASSPSPASKTSAAPAALPATCALATPAAFPSARRSPPICSSQPCPASAAVCIVALPSGCVGMGRRLHASPLQVSPCEQWERTVASFRTTLVMMSNIRPQLPSANGRTVVWFLPGAALIGVFTPVFVSAVRSPALSQPRRISRPGGMLPQHVAPHGPVSVHIGPCALWVSKWCLRIRTRQAHAVSTLDLLMVVHSVGGRQASHPRYSTSTTR